MCIQYTQGDFADNLARTAADFGMTTQELASLLTNIVQNVGIYDKQYAAKTGNTAAARDIYQTLRGNNLGVNGINANIDEQTLTNDSGNTQTGLNATQNMFTNGYATGTGQGNAYDNAYKYQNDYLSNTGNLYTQDFSNFMGVTGANATMAGTVLNGATQPLSTALLTSSGLLGSPLALYNGSIGLNNAGINDVNIANMLRLKAAQINNQNSGGGFWGGLAGGIGSGLGSALGGLFG